MPAMLMDRTHDPWTQANHKLLILQLLRAFTPVSTHPAHGLQVRLPNLKPQRREQTWRDRRSTTLFRRAGALAGSCRAWYTCQMGYSTSCKHSTRSTAAHSCQQPKPQPHAGK